MVVCVFNDGNSQGSTESSFMEKPKVEPATPGLHPIHHGGLTVIGLTTKHAVCCNTLML